MKVASALLACGLVLSGEPLARAAGPDDTYLQAYQLIQEGDQLIGTSQPELARQRYQQALENLKRLQSSYPNYSKQAVEFRLEYVNNKLQGMPAAAPKELAPTRPAAPAANDVAALNQRLAQMEQENQLLQAKLQEALAPRPAAVDPAEFAKAQERLKQLEKEKELLRAALDQAEAKKPNAAEALQLEQARAELESTRKKLVENISSLAALNRENQELKQQAAQTPAADPAAADLRARVAALEKERAELQAKLAAAPKSAPENPRVKDLESERDSLLKKVNDANKELYDLKARGQASQAQNASTQLANLRARLEVFEARKVPFTKEELALLDQNVPKLATKVEARPAAKKPRELPPGAGLIVADAERLFAQRRFNEAEEKYKQVLRLDEDNPVSLANLAAIQLELQKHDEAEANLKKAIAAAPEDGYPVSLLGMLRFQQGKYEEALDALSRSAQLDPKNPETQNYLGITLSQQGHREAAETALRKAITINPNYAGAHHNLAVVYATQKPPFVELAKYHYNKALALGQPANADLEKQLGGR